MNFARRAALVVLVLVADACGGGGDGITVTSHVATVSVAPSSSNITPGGTVQLTATPKDAQGNVLSGQATSWTSNNNAVATVVGGLVTGVTAGFASITATVGGVGGTASVNVAAPVTQYTITTSSSPTTGGTTTGGGTFNSGASVTVTATAASGFTFTNWTQGGTAVSTAAAYTFTATANRTLVANFTASGGGDCTPIAMTFPSTVNGSLTAGGCQLTGKPAAVYRFTASGSGVSAFTVTTSAFTPEIEVTNDPAGDYVFYSGASPVSAVWLLPPSTDLFRVVSSNGALGAFSITMASTVGTGCIPRTILPFTSVTYTGGTLASTDCVLTAIDNSNYDQYTMFSSKPCTITMTAAAPVNAYLLIYDLVTGAQVTTDDNAAGGTDARVQLAQCNSAGHPIGIFANSASLGQFGPYNLKVDVTGGVAISAGGASAAGGVSKGVAASTDPMPLSASSSQRRKPVLPPQ